MRRSNASLSFFADKTRWIRLSTMDKSCILVFFSPILRCSIPWLCDNCALWKFVTYLRDIYAMVLRVDSERKFRLVFLLSWREKERVLLIYLVVSIGNIGEILVNWYVMGITKWYWIRNDKIIGHWRRWNVTWFDVRAPLCLGSWNS